jgi:class 3 adenylate cyclase
MSAPTSSARPASRASADRLPGHVSELPSGTVTFLFSDIEGSTRLLKQLGDRWPEALGDHNRIMREALSATGGREVDRQGDSFFAVFPRARNAVAAAVKAQRDLAAHEWPDGARVRVRMALHTCEPVVGEEGYLGLDVVRAARICSLAQGGQVLVSDTTRALVRESELEGVTLRDAGEHTLKDLDHPERLFRLVAPELPDVVGTRPDSAADDPSALEWRGREEELASRALRTVRELDRGAPETLGPRIEREVAEALRSAGVPGYQQMAAEREEAAPLVERRPSRISTLLIFAVVALILASTVVLVVRAL